MSVRLFIGNLPYSATEADLREHLSSVGAPSQVVLPTDRETGRPLAVSEARPREDRPPGPRPGGFSSPRPGGGPPPGGGGFGAPRPGGFTPRPPDSGGTGGAPRSRNFGPDAPPKNKRKPSRKESERGPRGPIKERPVGRLYDADEDWRAQPEEEEGLSLIHI